jgi:hypothetical protein
MCFLDGEIPSGVHHRFVPIVEADQVGRLSIGTLDLDDFSVPIRRFYGSAADDDPITLHCVHRGSPP